MIQEKIIEAWIERREAERKEQAYSGVVRVPGSRKGGPSASNITSCIRLTWYYAHGIVLKGDEEVRQEVLNLASVERISDAYAHQDKFVRQLRALPGCEVLNDDDYWVRCGEIPARVDVRLKIDEVIWNIEFKSLGNYSFDRLQQYGLIGIPQYYAQCQVIVGGEDSPVLFYAKNVENGKIYEEVVRRDEELIEDIIEKGEAYYNRPISDRDTYPPDRPYDYSSVQCNACPARDECWFSEIQPGLIEAKQIAKEDRIKVRKLVDIVDKNAGGYNEYIRAYDNLKLYLELLHVRYGVDKLQLKGIRSNMFNRRVTTTNWNKLYKLVGEKVYNKLFIDRYRKAHRLKIEWERLHE